MTEWYDVSDLHRQFKQACLSEFAFLTAYGFELTSIDEEWYATEIVYQNSTTGIKVSFDTRDNDIFLYLIRLINGQIPAYVDAPSRWLYLDNLMRSKSPSSSIPRKGFGELLTPEDIELTLTIYASALREYGEDVLLGHFSLFSKLAPRINRPRSLSSIEEVRTVTSEEELNEQKRRLPAQIVGYFDAYFYELRRLLQNSEALSTLVVPEFLQGFKRVISIGGMDGLVVVHFPMDLEITFSEASTGRALLRFPSVPDAEEDSYEFLQFPESPVSNLVELISGEEGIGIGDLPVGESWGVRGFNAPQLKADSTTGEITWQSPWTRLVVADLYHLRYWEIIERAYVEANEDLSRDNLENYFEVLRRSSEVPADNDVSTMDTITAENREAELKVNEQDVGPELLERDEVYRRGDFGQIFMRDQADNLRFTTSKQAA